MRPANLLSSAAVFLCVAAVTAVPAGPGSDAALSTPSETDAPRRLPPLAASVDGVSIGGISSGADMAVNYMVAHSSTTAGAAIFAGNMYRCTVSRFEGDELTPCEGSREAEMGYSLVGCTNVNPTQMACDPAVRACPPGQGLHVMKCQGTCQSPEADSNQFVSLQNVSEVVAVARARARLGLIDDPDAHLAGKRIYVFRGATDPCYLEETVRHTTQFFDAFGANTLSSNSVVDTGHRLPSMLDGGVDGPGEALRHLYGASLRPPQALRHDESRLFPFGQAEFDVAGAGLAPSGLVYVPAACEDEGGCAVHVWLHGCGGENGSDEARRMEALSFARGLSFDRIADANRLIILYPIISYGARAVDVSQRQHCWDQRGETGDAYSDKAGAHVTAIRMMVERLLHQPASS